MNDSDNPDYTSGPKRAYRNVVLENIPTNRYPYLFMKYIFHDRIKVKEGIVLD